MALLAVWAACFEDRRRHCAQGEVPTVAVIAADRQQARIVHRYISGLLRSSKMLERMVVNETATRIELGNACAIEIFAASSVSVRGYTLCAVIADEIAFWSIDGADPDQEILAALRPGLATIPGSLLVAASSPHARRGELWRHYREHFGKDGSRCLVWRATSKEMNATLDVGLIEAELEADPGRAAAEWLAEFRTDVG